MTSRRDEYNRLSSAEREHHAALDQIHNQRIKLAAELRDEVQEKYNALLPTALTYELIDLLVPGHASARCSDTERDRSEGCPPHISEGSGTSYPHCMRCTLLSFLEDRYWPTGIILKLEFGFTDRDL